MAQIAVNSCVIIIQERMHVIVLMAMNSIAMASHVQVHASTWINFTKLKKCD